jgi:excisionase family DNA binding protein
MTVDDAAFVLGISRASAYAAIEQGEIKAKTIGRRKLVLTRALFAELGYET